MKMKAGVKMVAVKIVAPTPAKSCASLDELVVYLWEPSYGPIVMHDVFE